MPSLIVSSRLVLLAHHPSDVVAGALIGVVGAIAGALLVRARRRLGFTIDDNGADRAAAGAVGRARKGVARGSLAP